MTHPTIPEIVWASKPTELIHQHTMCVFCGPEQVPTKVFFIKGTSYCPTHAKQLIDKRGVH